MQITTAVICRRDSYLQRVWKFGSASRIDIVSGGITWQACYIYAAVNTQYDPNILDQRGCVNTNKKFWWQNKHLIHLIWNEIHCKFLFPADPSVHHRQKTVVTDMCYPTEISSLMDFGTPDCSLGKGTALLENTRCCLGDSRKCAPWFILAVKRHRAVSLTGRLTMEQRPVQAKSMRTIR